ncbi:hypothetical protein OAU50_06595 [Planctomycetota bacterium]|nr:hypothetical protein [Planctomycetota bacterium]
MRVLGLFVISVLMFAAGCKSTGEVTTFDWGPAYEDVSVPSDFEAMETKPFVRNDRSYGKYFYRSTKGLLRPVKVSKWFRDNLPSDGWGFQEEDMNDAKGTMILRFIKGDDQLTIKMNPDKRMSATERYSVLTIEMNSQYD